MLPDFPNIAACIQNPGDSEPVWLVGACTISRSPIVHPGDSGSMPSCVSPH
jgi:hypothetical protein